MIPDDMRGMPAGSWDELLLFLGGSSTSYTGDLMKLIERADPGNRELLRQVYPYHVAAWEAWVTLAPALTWGELDDAVAELGGPTGARPPRWHALRGL